MRTGILSCFLSLLVVGTAQADLNILVIGSSESYSDSGKYSQKPFDGQAVAEALQQIVDKDAKIRGNKKVVFENVTRKKTLDTAVGGGGSNMVFEYRCFSLAQYYFWPEGREERLKNLRGEAGTSWQYVVIIGDPYLIANMPGMYAEGVKLIADAVKEGNGKPILLMPWPASGSSIKHFGEVVYRVGRSGDIAVAPAAYAWEKAGKTATGGHPGEEGAFVAAASIYSEMSGRAATSKELSQNTLGRQALAVVKENKTKVQYKGPYDLSAPPNPFSMKYVSKRDVTFNHTGTSSENGIKGPLMAAMKRCMVTPIFTKPGATPLDFNYGRANTMFEANKRYKVDPEKFDRSYGFPMQEHNKTAAETMLYGIDKRFRDGKWYDDGTDLGIAFDMINQEEVGKDVRAIPIRLMWAKIQEANPSLKPLRDRWHMSRILDEASGTYMYTLLSGRCPVDDEPAEKNSDNWNRWLGRKIGYETAWRMAHLQDRAPGFVVRPSAIDSRSLAAGKPAALDIVFRNAPKSDVTVALRVQASGASVSPDRLTFTPQNYSTKQTVTLTGDGTKGVTLEIITVSNDDVFNAVRDKWTYDPAK